MIGADDAKLPVRDAQRETQQERAGELALVDAEAPAPEPPHELMTPEEEAELEQMKRAEALARPEADLRSLTISSPSLALAGEARAALRDGSDGDPAERILEELVAGEVGLGHELQGLEGVATTLLTRSIDRPELALKVAAVAREVFALSSAIRRRTENSLSAIAGLRAQRVLLAAHRGRLNG
jgi:hypothetical protein